jgi:hypothetical protein
MVFALYDFCEVAGFDDPLQVSQESPTVFAVDLAGQELGFVDVLKKACPPFQNCFGRSWPALPNVISNLAPSLPQVALSGSVPDLDLAQCRKVLVVQVDDCLEIGRAHV